jgi:NAD(P)-dependent dehydrogenase (short-subunit alcohol dehydrogenase family)
MNILEGKTILVTGSSRGIGAATARLARAYGAEVILHGKTASKQLEDLAKELNAPFIVADVADKQTVETAVAKAVDTAGHIDGLINSAGMAASQPFLESSDEHWEQIFRTNVLGTVHFCQAIIPQMQKQGGGRIVNVSSIRGDSHGASARSSAYAASKASIIALTTSLAKGLAPQIAVNAVSPGMTVTDMAKTWNDQVWAQAKSALVGRAGKPEEIAEALLFLVSDRASFITGQTVIVDGGYEIAGK